ncbi:hypothetical protein DP73_06970 [Desulfosporosinus sp. HMP52]|nr:hypothetical protein DP73_06970 [Desulfosporosinus sp. HMP52]
MAQVKSGLILDMEYLLEIRSQRSKARRPDDYCFSKCVRFPLSYANSAVEILKSLRAGFREFGR